MYNKIVILSTLTLLSIKTEYEKLCEVKKHISKVPE
jgi:hypothetical protein